MSLPAIRLLPNAITVLALCAGLSSVRFILVGDPGAAIAAIGVAAILDGLDGRLARLLGATSRMGAELDSLSDAISFGVAPALILYSWSLDNHQAGWLVALLYVVCMVLRLARFNTLLEATEQPVFAKEFFVGVPAPAGAMLALLPLIVVQQQGPGWWSSPLVVAGWTVLVSLLAVSRIPTLSVKRARVRSGSITPLLVGLVLVVAAIVIFPWAVLGLALLAYLAHLPIATRRYRWLAAHPEAWDAEPRQRRAIRRQHRVNRGLRLRRPPMPRVTGAALRGRLRPGAGVRPPTTTDRARRGWRGLGLRRSGRSPRGHSDG